MKMKTVKITSAESWHILNLMERNREDGIHTRPEKQYWERARRIEAKLGKPETVTAQPNDQAHLQPPEVEVERKTK